MKAISAYMANRSTDGDGRRREYENRANERRTDQYDARNAMGEYQPEGTEMRRRRDSRGRYMMDEDMPESRYRGRDGRWKAGTRRSEYDGGAAYNDPTGRRMGEDDDEPEMRSNVIEWPYGPHMPPESRVIGFGIRQRGYETRSHYDGDREEAEVGGTMWMQPVGHKHHGAERFDRETAEKWVHSMHNSDPARPKGARWSYEELKPMAQKFGIKTDGDEYAEFYAMTNAMYSDYCEVIKKFNITSPEIYGMLAKAWMDDKDAVEDKTLMYYECCVEK